MNWISSHDTNKHTNRSSLLSSSSRHYYLSSISCDGKILFWNTALLSSNITTTSNSNNKFRYPIGGLLLQESNEKSSSYNSRSYNHKSLFYGGTKMCLSSSLSSSCYQYIGTIAGSIIRIQNKLLHNSDKNDNKKRKPDGLKLKWSNNAIQALYFLQLQQQQDSSSSKSQLQISKLAKYIEEKAISKRKKGIDLACIYEIAKPSIDILFPCCINNNDNKNKNSNPSPSSPSSFFQFASHGSSITSIQSNTISSSQNNNFEEEDLILTSSLDGELRLYSSLYHEPLLILEPNNNYNVSIDKNSNTNGSCSDYCSNSSAISPLYDAKFSPFSPTVSMLLRLYKLQQCIFS